MVLSCLSPVACGGSTNSEGPASGGGASSGGGGTTAAGGAGGSARWDAGEDGDGAGTAADAASDAGGDAPLDSPSDGPPDVSTDSPWCICPSTSVDHSGRRRALQLQKSVFVSRLREGGVPRRVLLGRRLASGDYLGRPLRGRRVVAGSGGSRPSHPPATVTAQHAGVGPGKVRRQQHEAGATTFSERPPNAS